MCLFAVYRQVSAANGQLTVTELSALPCAIMVFTWDSASIYVIRKQLIKTCIYVHCPFLGWHVLSLTKLLTLIFGNSIIFIGNTVAFFLIDFNIIPWRVLLPVVSLCFFLIKSFGFSKGFLLWCSQISGPLNTL